MMQLICVYELIRIYMSHVHTVYTSSCLTVDKEKDVSCFMNVSCSFVAGFRDKTQKLEIILSFSSRYIFKKKTVQKWDSRDI